MGKMIEGLLKKELKQINNKKGDVLHMIRNDDPDFNSFGECYFSEIKSGSIKAWKFHSLQTQNIAVPIGLVLVVIYDTRTGSSSKNVVNKIILGRPNDYTRLTIPPKLWYGFKCISQKDALIVNCCDMPHNPNESTKINYDSNEIPYSW